MRVATRGSTPAVGSSMRKTTGSCIRLRAISSWRCWPPLRVPAGCPRRSRSTGNCSHARLTSSSTRPRAGKRSEEHTSELQSRFDLVCRLLLEKKKTYETYVLRDYRDEHCDNEQ